MKARWFSRGSLVVVALVSSLGVAACGRAQTSGDEAPSLSGAAQGQAPAATQRGPGQRLFRQIDALDLTDAQREDLSDIEDTLTAELSSHRGTARRVAETLVNGLEAGTLDTPEAARNQQAIASAAAQASASLARAMNETHDVLDADQREELIVTLRSQRAQTRGESGSETRGGARREGLAKIAMELGLSEGQKQAIRDEVQAQIDNVFPDRKAKREAWEAKVQALGDAFMSDDFDAEDFDLAEDAQEAIASFTSLASRAIDVSAHILDPSQRAMVASLLRTRAAAM